jgi:chloramphenicol 3-O phosphotransferase
LSAPREAALNPGRIVVLNGPPRSGKTSIATALQAGQDGDWMSLGVDVHARCVTPPRLRPGIGLRPGGERPDIETVLPRLFAALYDSVAAHSRLGFDVVVDVGHHDDYSRPLGILPDCARRLAGLPALLVGLHCPIEEIMSRRRQAEPGRETLYVAAAPGEPPPAPVQRWQQAVHRHRIYDLELDTAAATPAECAAAVLRRFDEDPPPSAFARLAASVSVAKP